MNFNPNFMLLIAQLKFLVLLVFASKFQVHKTLPDLNTNNWASIQFSCELNVAAGNQSVISCKQFMK